MKNDERDFEKTDRAGGRAVCRCGSRGAGCRPDGTYRGQIVWLRNPNTPDGTPKLDAKNPDKSKRSGRADRVVVVDGVKYDAEKGVWNGGRVYDPTKGKSYKVEVSFEDDRTLRVKGSLLGFSRSVYWQKIE